MRLYCAIRSSNCAETESNKKQPPDSWQKSGGFFHWRGHLLEGASGTGAVPAAGEERSNVVNKEAKGKSAADQGATGLQDGMDHHGTQLLSMVVSCC